MRCHLPFLMLSMILSVSAAQAAVLMHVDVKPELNTTIFRDYNGTSDANVAYNPGPASNYPTQNVSGGVSQWTYGAAVGDPKIIYNDGAGTYDFNAFPFVRMRYQQSRPGGTIGVWENPAQGGEATTLAQSTVFVESHGDPNSTLNPPDFNGSGYRIDPFGSSLVGDVFTADYVMIDRFETIGLGEWDADGDLGGWTTPNITGVSVAGSLLSGTGNGDARLEYGLAFNADKYKFLEIRMQTDSSDPNESQLFWALGGAFNQPQSIRFNVGDGQMHTYLLDFTNEPTWAGSNMRIRLDPVSGTDNFAVDFIRLRVDAVVPEPSSLALAAVGLLGLILSSRRRRGRLKA